MSCYQTSLQGIDKSVTVLTQGIARLLDINCPRQKVDKYIKHLQTLCFGTPEDKFSKYFGLRLTQDECVDCLLSLNIIQDYCLKNRHEGLIITSQLLSQNKLSSITSQFLASILPELISNTSIFDASPILESLWTQKEKATLPQPLVECMLLERKPVEIAFIEIYLSGNACWEDHALRHWVRWGAQSSFAFQTITTVLNNILIQSNQHFSVLKIVYDYVQCVLRLCSIEKTDFVKLYPLEYQSLVPILMLDPDYIKSDPFFLDLEMFLVKSLKPLFISDPAIAVMLLSHFKKWIPSFESPDL